MTELPIRGSETGALLGDVSPLLAPRRLDAWGRIAPEPSEAFLQLSAELAASAYGMAVEDWLRAGWHDVTIQVDGSVVDGVDASAPEAQPRMNIFQRLAAAFKLRQVQRKMQPQSTLSQMLGAVRKMNTEAQCKAMVMLHPVPDGRYVVAIGFMGTGKQLADWIPNFRMMADDGVHRGFLQLARQFERNEDAVTFPETAAALGLDKLTLSDIITECRQPGSRFVLWLAGHSQGGAVMQTWAYLKLTEDGVLPANLLGCGFASPSVLTGDAEKEPSAWPLWHVVNAEDVIPRMGARVHLGRLLVYPTDAKLHAAVPAPKSDAMATLMAKQLLRSMRATPDGLVLAAAYLTMLADRPLSEIIGVLGRTPEALTRIKALANAADGQRDKLIATLLRHTKDAYVSLTGEAMPMQRVQRQLRRLVCMTARVSLNQLIAAMAQQARAAHTMCSKPELRGVYPWIVDGHTAMLKPAIWQSGRLPLLLHEGEEPLVVCDHREREARRVPRYPHRAVSRSRMR